MGIFGPMSFPGVGTSGTRSLLRVGAGYVHESMSRGPSLVPCPFRGYLWYQILSGGLGMSMEWVCPEGGYVQVRGVCPGAVGAHPRGGYVPSLSPIM